MAPGNREAFAQNLVQQLGTWQLGTGQHWQETLSAAGDMARLRGDTYLSMVSMAAGKWAKFAWRLMPASVSRSLRLPNRFMPTMIHR
eukprot:1156038-Pelagomonas_calceolata.AAC.4